jgi:hypothetical protein
MFGPFAERAPIIYGHQVKHREDAFIFDREVKLKLLALIDHPTFRGASDERDALSRASSCARSSGSGSMVSGSYITRATLPTPSITPLRNRSHSRVSLMAAPLACPLPVDLGYRA